ncbi:hypothetical protein EVAR_90568_1 [Eumeta japonica]|uniref:DDE-1 domain-containing protein n=1 Tax=Eumeta variegata TaxID=151549 RepID=A0A4C1YVP8_EUMVA|nr:hypothetical protein EVAR_90568_1 [Eumeta japonica]
MNHGTPVMDCCAPKKLQFLDPLAAAFVICARVQRASWWYTEVNERLFMSDKITCEILYQRARFKRRALPASPHVDAHDLRMLRVVVVCAWLPSSVHELAATRGGQGTDVTPASVAEGLRTVIPPPLSLDPPAARPRDNCYANSPKPPVTPLQHQHRPAYSHVYALPGDCFPKPRRGFARKRATAIAKEIIDSLLKRAGCTMDPAAGDGAAPSRARPAAEGCTRAFFYEMKSERGNPLKNQSKYIAQRAGIAAPHRLQKRLCPPSEKVLLDKGSRSAYKVVDSERKVLLFYLCILLMVIVHHPCLCFLTRLKCRKNSKNCPEGWGVGLSDNGWMTAESFYEYITNVFYPWLVKQGTEFPIVIYLDNHSSHITMPLVTFCREKGIELIGLVPNSTHIMQPLDISFFHPFKETWKKAVPRWKNSKNIARVKKEDFPLVLEFALKNMKEEKNTVISGFKAAGLYPFDSSAVDYDVFNKRKKSKTPVTEEKIQDKLSEDEQKHLLTFENNLSKDILEAFNNAWLNQTWPEDSEMRGLYKYWLQISGKPGFDETSKKPTVKEVTLVNINLNKKRQEQLEQNFVNSRNDCDISLNDNNLESNESVSPEVIYEFVIENESLENFSEADILEHNTGDELKFDSNVLVADSQTGSLDTTSVITNITNVPTTTLTTPVMEKNSDPQINLTLSESVVSKENDSKSANEIETNVGNPFDQAFKMPTKYLPKKKRIKVESSHKPKLPSAGTSDQWMQYHSKKENDEIIKKEKQERKKQLQEQKKRIADERKKLQDQIKRYSKN